MRIGVGSDRGGRVIVDHLRVRLSQANDLLVETQAFEGTEEYRAVVDRLCVHLRRKRIERALLICSSALGASMAANKIPGVRAALCHDDAAIRLAVQDHGMNCLVIDSVTVTSDFACSLADTFCDENLIQQSHASGVYANSLISVVEHIRANLSRPLDVNELSKLAAMSQSHFSKLFKISMGVSPHQFILSERVDRSKQLLRKSSARIVDIAFAVGFETQAHFTTVFGNLVGMTPMQFRRTSAESSVPDRRPVQVGGISVRRNARRNSDFDREGSIPMIFTRIERTGSDRTWASQ